MPKASLPPFRLYLGKRPKRGRALGSVSAIDGEFPSVAELLLAASISRFAAKDKRRRDAVSALADTALRTR
jgi:hypothetical protein